ncbi:UNVERIFIED_CONTAM: hypothetical protein FKN15_018512 [Acipenser sinensis]
MPLFEGLGTGGEKTAVVIDLGTAYTKCGFAGESGPRCIIPSEIQRTGKAVKVVQHNINTEELYSNLKEFIHMLYFSRSVEKPACKVLGVSLLPRYLTGSIPEEILEDIKVRVSECAVSPMLLSVLSPLQRPAPPPDVDYPLDGEKILHIKGALRDSVIEMLFEQDNEEKLLMKRAFSTEK